MRRNESGSPRWERERVPKSGGQDRRGRHAVGAEAPLKRPPPRHALVLSRAASFAMYLIARTMLRAVYAPKRRGTLEQRSD